MSDSPAQTQPLTLPHTFTHPALLAHFTKTPNPPGVNALIDQPGDVFLPTAEEITVIAAALYVVCVSYDNLPPGERPEPVAPRVTPPEGKPGDRNSSAEEVKQKQAQTQADDKAREALRKWILSKRLVVVNSLLNKIEPPFSAWSQDQIMRDVAAMTEELLIKPQNKAK